MDSPAGSTAKPNLLQRVARSWLDAIFPPKCTACGVFTPPQPPAATHPHPDTSPAGEDPQALVARFARIMGSHVCAACAQGFTPIHTPLCPRCGIPYSSTQGVDHLCARCAGTPPVFAKARAAGVHHRTLMTLIHALKYGNKIELAQPLGRLLWEAYVRFWDPGTVDLVIPVPLHPQRMRRRGFNQSALMLASWPRFSGADPNGADSSVGAGIEIARGILVRRRATAPQTGLGRRERRANIAAAFEIGDAANLHGRHILLVDDVFTTGATSAECARTLQKSGAARVDVLTVARTL